MGSFVLNLLALALLVATVAARTDHLTTPQPATNDGVIDKPQDGGRSTTTTTTTTTTATPAPSNTPGTTIDYSSRFATAAPPASRSHREGLGEPVPNLCRSRPRGFSYGGHNYFLATGTTDCQKTAGPVALNWLAARNYCRQYCMESVSIQTEEEHSAIVEFMTSNSVKNLWTSGRLCNFSGCEGRFPPPVHENGWFWLGTDSRVRKPFDSVDGWTQNPWSRNGPGGDRQPDNYEHLYTSTAENCIAVQANFYKDGVKWHDKACYHLLNVLCEDSDLLISYVRQSYGIKL